MKKGYKLCPFCANEIKEGAIKCQYCHEFLSNVNKEGKVKQEDTVEIDKTGDGGFLNGRTLKSIIKCEGRLNRGEYWFYLGCGILGYYACCFLYGFIIGIFTGGEISDIATNIGVYGLLIPYLLWSIVIYIGRAHDLGKPWTYILLLLIPIINIFVGIEFGFVKGKNDNNKFGDEPCGVGTKIIVISVILWTLAFLIMLWANA